MLEGNSTPQLELELRRGVVVLATLSQLGAPRHGYEPRQALADEGSPSEEDTLYPLLRRLESRGVLSSEWRTDGGAPRRYYAMAVLTWFSLAGPMFVESVPDKTAHAFLWTFVLLLLIDVALKTCREVGRLRMPDLSAPRVGAPDRAAPPPPPAHRLVIWLNVSEGPGTELGADWDRTRRSRHSTRHPEEAEWQRP